MLKEVIGVQEQLDYDRIAEAIAYIRKNFRSQPSLDELATQVHLSPFHFQRLFTEWAGVSPKKFLQFTSLEYAKGLLREKQANLFDAALDTGLSGTGRLHDLFVRIEDRKSTRLNSSHSQISYAVFCLK